MKRSTIFVLLLILSFNMGFKSCCEDGKTSILGSMSKYNQNKAI